MDSGNLARLCTLDSGVTVDPQHVRNWIISGNAALSAYDPDARHEINVTLLKAFADPESVPWIEP